jgi:hypothetical protein
LKIGPGAIKGGLLLLGPCLEAAEPAPSAAGSRSAKDPLRKEKTDASFLPPLADLAARLLRGLGLRGGLFGLRHDT